MYSHVLVAIFQMNLAYLFTSLILFLDQFQTCTSSQDWWELLVFSLTSLHRDFLHCCLCIILSASVLQYLIQSLHLVCLYRLVLLLLIATLTGCKLQSCQSFLPFFETEHSRTWCTTCISEILLSYDQLQAAPSIDWEAITWRSP